jgi:hypothetical protein
MGLVHKIIDSPTVFEISSAEQSIPALLERKVNELN